MGRLSIELPEHQHKQIKALAAWRGLSLKDYIIERTIPAAGEGDAALAELLGFLAPRIEAAAKGDLSRQSMTDIIAKAKLRRPS
ncbi:MAG: antitoxin [Alphaproteobacteria bacterium]|nr:antitoxin [Alphaproteobacteria bacterium]